MKKRLPTLLLAAALLSLAVADDARATNYNGNGHTGFNGAVGDGLLSVTNDGSGGFYFTFTLGNGQTTLGGNDLAIYLDNGSGSVIGADTSGLTDAGDGSREAVSEYDGTDRSTINFGGFLNPQYSLDLSISNANIFTLANGTANYGFAYDGGAAANGASTGGGVTYTVTTNSTNAVLTADVPSAAFGLSSFSGKTLKFFAIQVSETGYSSNEATVSLNSTGFGYGTTQTLTSVDTFTAAVPEPGASAMMLIGGLGVLGCVRRRGLAPRLTCYGS